MALWLACGAAAVRGIYDKFRNYFGFCYCALFERGVHLSLGKSRFAAIRAFAVGIGGGDFRFLGQHTHAAQSGQAWRSAVVRLCVDGKTSAGSDLFPAFSAVLSPARIQLTTSPAVALAIRRPHGSHSGECARYLTRRRGYLSKKKWMRFISYVMPTPKPTSCASVRRTYVLMTNHVHSLVAGAESGSVPRMMQRLGRRYVAWRSQLRSAPLSREAVQAR